MTGGIMMGIYDYNLRMKMVLRRLENLKICDVNKGYIKCFLDYLRASGMSKPRMERYVYTLKDLAQVHDKDFKGITKQDVVHMISVIESRDYSVHTKNIYKIMFKRFIKWLFDSETMPAVVSWLKSEHRRAKVMPDELLTQAEVKALIEVCKNYRDKAFIATMYESGCRVSEIGNLLVKHVSFDEYGAVIMVDGKTGQRRVRLINSIPFLAEWLNHHPCRSDPTSPLWPALPPNKPLTIGYRTISLLLKRASIKAGIKKRVNPHSFRHARATLLASHLTEAQMKEYLGWVQDSNMASTYIHLSGRDVDKALLKMNGIAIVDDNKQGELELINCSRCGYKNAPTNKFCGKCGLALDIKEALAMEKANNDKDKLLNLLINDPEVRNILVEKAKVMARG